MSRKYTNLVLEKVEQGLLDHIQVLRDALMYMSEDELEDFAESNGYAEDEEDEEPEYEYSDKDDVREAFKQFWKERCNYVPAYRTDKPAKRMAFTCFVDDLQMNGRISDDLANDVTLGEDE